MSRSPVRSPMLRRRFSPSKGHEHTKRQSEAETFVANIPILIHTETEGDLVSRIANQVNDAQGGAARAKVELCERELRQATLALDNPRIDLAEKALSAAQQELEEAGTTALMVAAFRGDEQAVVELLQVGQKMRLALTELDAARRKEVQDEKDDCERVAADEKSADRAIYDLRAHLYPLYSSGEAELSYMKPKVRAMEEDLSALQQKKQEAHLVVLQQGEAMEATRRAHEAKRRALQSRLTSTDVFHPRSDGWYPITVAAMRHHPGVVRILSEARADVDTIIPSL